MKKTNRTFAIQRILVALDASPHSLAALDAAVELAARMEAELLGLFVEDVHLLDLADSPLARQILYPSAQETPLSRESMEREMRAQAEQARKALETAADRAQVQWSFRAVRGRVTSEVLAAAGEADLLAVGKVGWSFGGQLRIGSTALEVATSAVPVLLLPEHGVPADVKLVVHYDGSLAAKRGLLAAAQLAKPGTNGITVLIATADQESAERMQKEADDLLKERDVAVKYRRIDPQNEAELLRMLKAVESKVFVLGGRKSLGRLEPLETLLRELEMPLLLFGDGPENEEE